MNFLNSIENYDKLTVDYWSDILCLYAIELNKIKDNEHLGDNDNLSEIVKNIIQKKTLEYVGKSTDQRIMIDTNGINIITEDSDGNIVKIDCKENI